MSAPYNTTGYTGNNPINYLDPTGNYWWCESYSNGNYYSHAPPCDDDNNKVWIPDPVEEDDDDCSGEGSNDDNDDSSGSSGGSSGPTLGERIEQADEAFSNAAGTMPELSQEYLDEINSLVLNESGDDVNGLLSELLDLTQDFTGREDVGVVGIVNEFEATGIIGIHADTGTYLDSNGNFYSTENGSVVVRSNIEVGADTKVTVMPYLDDINKLGGLGMSAGADLSLDLGVSAGIGIGLASADKESLAITIPIGFGIQVVPYADVYLNVGYTEISEYGSTQEEIDEELLERLNNMQLGGY